MNEFYKNLILLFSGAILGYFGSFITISIERIKQKNKFKRRLLLELKNKMQELIADFYNLKISAGAINEDDLKWVYEFGEKFKVFDEKTLQVLKSLLNDFAANFTNWLNNTKANHIIILLNKNHMIEKGT